jgi:hypothetical protein
MMPTLSFSRQVGRPRDSALRITPFNRSIKIRGLFITSLFAASKELSIIP